MSDTKGFGAWRSIMGSSDDTKLQAALQYLKDRNKYVLTSKFVPTPAYTKVDIPRVYAVQSHNAPSSSSQPTEE
jgi:hypothetical protein